MSSIRGTDSERQVRTGFLFLSFDTLSCSSQKPFWPIGNSQLSHRIITQTEPLSRAASIFRGALKRAKEATEPKEPVAGGSCSDMQDYFNKNFGRRDTEFSNYEGTIESNVFNMLVCGGGVVIQTLPTGKKTCTAWIRVLKDKTLDWYSESYADCFISQ